MLIINQKGVKGLKLHDVRNFYLFESDFIHQRRTEAQLSENKCNGFSGYPHRIRCVVTKPVEDAIESVENEVVCRSVTKKNQYNFIIWVLN